MFGDYFIAPYFFLIMVFVISAALSFIAAKKLWQYSVRKGFTAEPNHRSSHSYPVPVIGGIILFFSIVIPFLLVSHINFTTNVIFIILSFVVLFLVGVVDDIKNASVRIKLIGQFITAIFLILSLNNQELVIPFLEEYEYINKVIRIVFWVIAVVAIINAYNFIDGIDGLAIGLGSVSSLAFSIYFIIQGNVNLSLLGIALTGGLLGLLYQNLSLKRKMFIGDTGSLIIGGIISLFVLRYLEMNATDQLILSSSMVVGVLFIPIADLIRVFGSRVLNGKSPLKADRTHIHHILMDRFGISHRRTSFVIILLQIIIFFAFFLYNKELTIGQMTFSLFMFLSYTGSVEVIKRLQIPNHTSKAH